MTPKEKDTAEDIFVQMLETIPDDIIQDNETASKLAKLHALICVDELILSTTPDNNPRPKNRMDREYWQYVKSEIEKL